MISDAYRALNAKLHRDDRKYGIGGARWAPHVQTLAAFLGAETVLDYGCGKGMLGRELARQRVPFTVAEYDPCVPGKDAPPAPADVVVCADVLEHVETEHVDAVLAHVVALTRCVALISVCIVEGKRRLPDGRPAHVTVQPEAWWLEAIARAAAVRDMTLDPISSERDDTRTWLLR